MKCETCRYFTDWDMDRRKGLCRRFPPVPVTFHSDDRDENDAVAVFPEVHFEDWCGEYLAARLKRLKGRAA